MSPLAPGAYVAGMNRAARILGLIALGAPGGCALVEGAAPGTLTEADARPSAPSVQPFLPAERCALCHSGSPRATALRNAAGEDVSPFATWQASAMANAFRDPYWRAQMAQEVEFAPARAAEIEGLCLTCHAPAAHHGARLAGKPAPRLAGVLADSLAQEGVTCTVCHRAGEHGLGTPQSFSGNLDIHGDARLYGPYESPFPGPMRMHTGFTPTFGPHVSRSALCGACHTLITRPAATATPFLEQATYLEWRNSVYSDEHGASADSRTCQACHMPDEGSMRIARNPGGRDFNLRAREHVRSHVFLGANTLLARILRDHGDELGVRAPPAAFERVLQEARAFLGHAAARLEITRAQRDGTHLEFDVRVENLAGHKLPSGYPSRRAWLAVEVRQGEELVFTSGAWDERGHLVGVADELALPHFDRIERPQEVQVYEMVAQDEDGHVTTSLGRMARRAKDTRLLPRGWRADGPDAAATAPLGPGTGDDDFAGGGDTVTYSLTLPAAAPATLRARLCYQSVPPAWAAALDGSDTEAVRRFLALYERAELGPEILARVVSGDDVRPGSLPRTDRASERGKGAATGLPRDTNPSSSPGW